MNAKLIKNLSLGTLTGAVTTAVMLLLLNLAAIGLEDPRSILGAAAFFALYSGAFAGGFCTVKLNREKGMFLGAMTGGALGVILLVCALIYGSGGFLPRLLVSLSLVPVSAVSGVIALPSQKHKRKRHY